MYQFVLGTIVGIYLEQTYHLPNLYDKWQELDRYLKEKNVIMIKNNIIKLSLKYYLIIN